MSMIGHYVRVSPAQLAELLARPDSVEDFLYPDSESLPANHLDIDKAWHAIHFLLNGQTWEGEPPLVSTVLGGQSIGEVDVGYGPARYLEPAEVSELADALSAVSSAELLKRFDPAAMNEAEIYPQGWSDKALEREYVASNYQRLVEFMRSASTAGEAVILYLS